MELSGKMLPLLERSQFLCLFVEKTKVALATSCSLSTLAQCRGQLTCHNCCRHEDTEREQVFKFDDDEGIRWRKEKEVKGEQGEQRSKDCGIQSTCTC